MDVIGLILVPWGRGHHLRLAQLGDAAGLDTAAAVAPLVVLVGFVVQALRARRSLLDLPLYASRAFTAASVAQFALGAANFGGMILMPWYLQTVRAASVVQTRDHFDRCTAEPRYAYPGLESRDTTVAGSLPSGAQLG
jgi:hypothetical protein